MVTVAQIQAQLRYSAQQSYPAVASPPFTCFFNPDDAGTSANYAIPDLPVGGNLRAPLAALRHAFAMHGRRARVEFVEAFAPDLAPALRAAGFIEEARTELLLCLPATLQTPPAVPGLVISMLPHDAPLADVQDFVTVQRRAFGSSTAPAATALEAQQHLLHFAGRAFLARLDGQAVGAGSLTPPFHGLSEAAGIATLTAFRRRGVATALTAQMTQTAFAQGSTAVFLTAADERAGRVYQRVGFQPYGVGLAYIDAKDRGPARTEA